MLVGEEFETSAICRLSRQLGKENQALGSPLASREILESYASTFGLETTGKTDEQLAQEITAHAPCNWIAQVENWARNDNRAAAVNQLVRTNYFTDLVEHGVPDSSKADLIYQVNQAIYAAPRTSQSFVVYHGTGVSDQPIQAGQVITVAGPENFSFSLDVLSEMYINFQVQPACCVAKVFIPINSIAIYHPFEDRVILPSGATFYVLSNPTVVEMFSAGQTRAVRYYELIYIDAPVKPERLVQESVTTVNKPTTNYYYDKITPSDAYAITIIRNLPFPTSTDPYTALYKADDLDDSYVNRIQDGQFDPNSPSEVRLYLASGGANISAYSDYDAEQMQKVLEKFENRLD